MTNAAGQGTEAPSTSTVSEVQNGKHVLKHCEKIIQICFKNLYNFE